MMMMMLMGVGMVVLLVMLLIQFIRLSCLGSQRWLSEVIEQIIQFVRPALSLCGGRHHLSGGAIGATNIQRCGCHRLLQLLYLVVVVLLSARQQTTIMPMGWPIQMLMRNGTVVNAFAFGAAEQLLSGAADGATCWQRR